MDGRILYRIDFDNLENHSPITKQVIAVAGPKDNLTADGNMSEYISQMNPTNLYKGYNGEVYPKFVIESINIL